MGLQRTSAFPHGRPRPVQGGDQPSARDIRALIGCVFGAHGEYPLELTPGPNGMIARLAGPILTSWDLFGYRSKPGNTITIRKRTIRIHQEANVKITERDVPLAGTTCWVYAAITRANYALAGIMTAAVEPMSDEGAINVPLYCFTFVAASGTYVLDDPTKFDVNLGE